MSCDVRSCDELSSIVRCTECYERKTPLVVRSRCVVRSGSVTMWWSKSIFLYYSSTTPVLLRTAQYCCSTTLYYGSTTLYYKVLLQYYSYPPHHWPYSSDLGGDFELKNATFGAPAIPQNFTKCWACNESHTPPSPNIAPATQKMNLMIDPPHIWNVFDNALGTKSQPPTSPNTLRLSPKICDMLRLKSDTPTSPNAVPANTTTSPNAAPATKAHTPPSPSPAPVMKNALYSSLRIYSLRIYSLYASILYASILNASILYSSILANF